MRRGLIFMTLAVVAVTLGASACAKQVHVASSGELTDDEINSIVRQSYRYVAMHNVNNKFAIKQGGWNTVDADTELKDHTMRAIARPNNDTLYIGCMLDVRAEPAIIEMPAFDSDYVSLMITAYDHHVNVPMTSRLGDFAHPQKLLVYSTRTDGYDGGDVEGVDRTFEATGDFVSAVFRVMPHASDSERFAKIVGQMQSVRLMTLSEYRGGEALPVTDPGLPAVGQTDFDIFGNNFLEVMQFVFNHTTFDQADPIDRGVLAVFAPLGVAPGRTYDSTTVVAIDGSRFRQAAERVWAEEMAKSGNPNYDHYLLAIFKPKGQISGEVLLFQSVLGPIGLPAEEAVYPAIVTADGEPMNAMHDYVIRMSADKMPPARAFWSVTLYDTANGFFIPNDRKKYSVGANAGMKLDDDGGIAIYIAAEQPPGVPEENWLPINREDIGIGPIMRIYAPDLERFKNWTAPKAEKIEGSAG